MIVPAQESFAGVPADAARRLALPSFPFIASPSTGDIPERSLVVQKLHVRFQKVI